MAFFSFILIIALRLIHIVSANRHPSQHIAKTSSGAFRGHAHATFPDVTEFLSVPFAAPPVGSRRFLPAQPFQLNTTCSKDVIDASKKGPICPQLGAHVGHVASETPQAGRILDALLATDAPQSEDCLTMNIWMPRTQATTQHKRGLPTFIFASGGHGRTETSGPQSSIYDGGRLAHTHNVIVISFNYRVNIFGFPSAPTVAANAALTDIRMALTWTRDNIAAFGGSSARIVAGGQSAGALYVDMDAYAHPHDPIAKGYILESGAVMQVSPLSLEQAGVAWNNATISVNCNKDDEQATLACMQNVSTSDLLGALAKQTQTLASVASPPFQPAIDNRTVFSNPEYIARGQAGRLSKVPVLLGNNANERGFFIIQAANVTKDPFNSVNWTKIEDTQIICPAAFAAQSHARAGASVFRYLWQGAFDDVQLYNGSGAWHAQETLYTFGNVENVTGIHLQEQERRVRDETMATWASFIHDPEEGLKHRHGWQPYSKKHASYALLAHDNSAKFVQNSTTYIDTICRQVTGA